MTMIASECTSFINDSHKFAQLMLRFCLVFQHDQFAATGDSSLKNSVKTEENED